MTRTAGIVLFLLLSLVASAQGDHQVRAKADALFDEKGYVQALPLYSQLVSLSPTDRTLNYRLGTCLLFSGTDKDKAIGHLKFATQDPSIPPEAWYWLGRAYHLNYQFKDAQAAYQRYQGTGSKKELEGFPIASLDKQCRNGQNLLSNLKEITVHNKVEAEGTEFFRFYELGDIGGKIVVLPEELKTSLDKKSKQRTLVYLPEKGGAIYFASYGKDGKTGRDIYRTELLTNGTFAPPVKLAGYVNTDQDEDFAFLHPDGRSFYFSSKGHNSMGGYDVFRSAYDKTSDTFGPAENLDFAVNTPDDDLFYVTDAENKQACFASGRDSQQGKLHVYRVGTAQVPLVVTVLKGTYANGFDANDRKAHIVVEDAVTHERVADVRTDINGSYALSLPRSGKFRYAVECGAAGRTHSGTVEVPRSTTARAYRQELELTKKGDLEELVIRNYFDTPLEEDMIALMMEEIKRRAKLDITGDRPVAVQPEAPVEPQGDLMTKAGFAGDIDEAKAVLLAKDDAQEQEALVATLDAQSRKAYALAAEASGTAEDLAKQSTTLAEQATNTTDEAQRTAQMQQAAVVRQRSREANLRARAAYHTATDLDAERMAVQQRAATADKLATDLAAAMQAKQNEATLAHLRTLKQRLDIKSGPEGDVSIAEKARRDLTEQEKEAARRMNMATAKRTEEMEFADRIDRQKRERDQTRNKARIEELSKAITEQEQQLAYLHAEVEGAFNNAREQERSTSVSRGQHTLLQHLATQTGSAAVAAPSKEQMAALGQRIAGNDVRIAAIPVDDRFDGSVNEPVTAMETRSFNWNVEVERGALAAATVPTVAISNDGPDQATTNAATTTATRSSEGEGARNGAADPARDSGAATDLAHAGSAIGEVRATEAGNATQEAASAGTGATLGATTIGSSANTAGNTVVVNPSSTANTQQTTDGPQQGGSGSGSETDQALAVTTTGTEQANNGNSEGEIAQGHNVEPANSEEVVSSDRVPSESTTAGTVQANNRNSEGANAQGHNDEPAKTAEAQGPDRVPGEGNAAGTTAEMADFLRQNERAELEQSIAAERNVERREELKTQLAQLDERANAGEAAASEATAVGSDGDGGAEMDMEGVDMARSPITFYADTKEEDILAQLYPAYEADRSKLSAVEDPAARAEGLGGLELMLADSLRGEMVRQAAILEMAPQQSDVVRPKIERLRMLRQQHVQAAERFGQVAAALAATEAEQRAGLERTTATRTYPRGQDPIADRFVSIQHDPEEVYASKLEHRSNKVQEAVAAKDADLARMTALDDRIDSLEEALVDLPRKEYEKKRREADRLIDERMIIRADLGQRSAFLTKEEWRTTADSLKGIDKQLATLGLPPDEHLLRMAADMQTQGKSLFSSAETLRKQADRTEDILARDSLYRVAYGEELKALAEMDKAITVKTYLLGNRFQRGESLAYEDVAKRVLGIEDEETLAVAERLTTEPATNIPTSSASGGNVAQVTEQGTDEAIGGENGVATMNEQEGTLTTTPAESEQAMVAGATTSISSSTPAIEIANTERARLEAQAMADRTEQGLPTSSRVPVKRYEDFLTGESVVLNPAAADPSLDPSVFASRIKEAGEESARLEQRSMAQADRATSLEDSASTANKRERERLTELAVRVRQEADSLHRASVEHAEQARSLEIEKRNAEQAANLHERLVKYYYLTTEEQAMVQDDQDMSRYFQAKARALEQYEAATEADNSARANRELSEVLRKEANAVANGFAEGTVGAVEAAAKREVLYSRAEMLAVRADSLSDIAARLRGAANINESQAGVMLQSLPAHRSTEWMALEMRTRRTDAQLAQVPVALGGGTTAQVVPGGRSATLNNGATNDRRGGSEVASEVAATATEPVPTPPNAVVTGSATDGRSAASTPARGTAQGTAMPVFEAPITLEQDIFEVRPAGDRVTTIPMDARMPGGIVFKVQVGAFRTALSEESFSDMTPVMGEHTESGLVRYTAGLFNGFQQAAVAKDKVRDRGYRDAFVVAYRDGVRIPLGVAMREARQTQPVATEQVVSNTAVPTTASGTSSAAPATAAGNTTATAGNGTAMEREQGNTVLEPVRTSSNGNPTAPAIIQRPLEPLPSAPTPAAVTTEQILAKYPASAEAINASFTIDPTAADYYNVPGAAPAVQVETIKGLFYTVQVGVYSKPVALDKLFNITPLNSERTATAKVRYTTGRYMDTEQARLRKDQAVGLGVKDAFVTAYLNGKRIPMQEAATLLQQYGPAILAQP